MDKQNRTALITGASSGIGYELSKLFAADGYNLVLVARSEGKLQALAADLRQSCGIWATVLACDLGDPTAAEAIWSATQQQNLAIDVLVNNAGFGLLGHLADMAESEVLDMLHLNVLALTMLTRHFVPPMTAHSWGRVLNIGSTASFQPVPSMAVYAATKAYVLSFSEALAHELRGTGVSVTALCPGVTRTGFQSRAQVAESRLVQWSSMSAAQVARIGYRALMRGQTVVVPGLLNQLLAFSVRLTPRSLVRQVGEWAMQSNAK